MPIRQKRFFSIYYAILILILSFPTYASVKDVASNTLAVGIGFGQPSLNHELKSKNGPEVVYKPNVENQLILSLSYDNYGLSFGFNQGEENTDVFGKSDYDDYQFRFFMGRFTLEAFYQNYKGFYIENFNAVIPSSTTPILLENLESKKHFLSATYSFNKDFTLDHPYSTGQIQTKSGGSWLLQANLVYNSINNGSQTIIPLSSPNDYGSLENLVKARSFAFSIGPGYSYTFLISSFYINLSFLLLPSLQYKEFDFTDEESDDFGLDISSAALKVALGWNQPGWKLGFELKADNFSTKLEDESEVNATTINSALLFHMRKKF